LELHHATLSSGAIHCQRDVEGSGSKPLEL